MISQNNQRIAELSSENIGILSADLFPDSSGTLTDEQIQEIKEIADKDVVLFLQSDNEYVYTAAYKIKTNDYSIFEFIQSVPGNSQGNILTLIEITANYTDKMYQFVTSEYEIKTNGDGTKFLANDGSYKEISAINSPFKKFVLVPPEVFNLANDASQESFNSAFPNWETMRVEEGFGNNTLFYCFSSVDNIIGQDNPSYKMRAFTNAHYTEDVSGNQNKQYYTFDGIYGDGYRLYYVQWRVNSSGFKFLKRILDINKVSTFQDLIITNGNGNSYLSNDGTYKEINTSYSYILDINIFNKGLTGTIEANIVQELDNAINNKIPIYFYDINADTNNHRLYPVTVNQSSEAFLNNIVLAVLINSSTIQEYTINRADNSYTIKNIIFTTNDNVLTKTNTTEYTPTNDYNPTTKKYVDDMLRSFDFSDHLKTYSVDVTNGIHEGVTGNKKTIIVEGINAQSCLISFYVYSDNLGINLFIYSSGEGYKKSSGQYQEIDNSALAYNGIPSGKTKYYIESTFSNRVLTVTLTAKECYLTESDYNTLGSITSNDGVLYFITED